MWSNRIYDKNASQSLLSNQNSINRLLKQVDGSNWGISKKTADL